MDDRELIDTFVVEAREHLANIESQLLAIEAGGENLDLDLVNQVFRAIHSIKGTSSFFGFSAVQSLAHEQENVLNLVRNQQLVPNSSMTDVLLRAADTLCAMIEDINHSNEVDISQHVSDLRDVASGRCPAHVAPVGATGAMPPHPPAATITNGACRSDLGGLCELGRQVLSTLADGEITASPRVIDALLEMCDTVAAMADLEDAAIEQRGPEVAALADKLRTLLPEAPTDQTAATSCAASSPRAWPAPGTELAPDVVADFKVEGLEGIQTLEAALLEFERSPHDKESLRTIFRVIHNIKGAADYVGLAQIKTLSHRLEDILDLARSDRCEMSASISDLVFRSVDELKAMIANLLPTGEQDRDLAALVAELEATKQTPASAPPFKTRSTPASDDDQSVYVNSAEQQLESIATCCSKLVQGDASDIVVSMLHRGVTTLLAAATYLEPAPFTIPARELLGALEELRRQRRQTCETLAVLDAQRLPDEVANPSGRSVVACCEEMARGNSSDSVLTTLVRDLAGLNETVPGCPVELVHAAATFVRSVDEFRGTRDQHRKWLQTFSEEAASQAERDPQAGRMEPAGAPEQLAIMDSTDPIDAPAAKKSAGEKTDGVPSASVGGSASKTMRVDQGKLDDYINLAGELVIARNALVHDFGKLRIDGAHHNRLKESVERIQRITADIQANAMTMRMVPVMTVFQRFPRMIRDIAKALGKQIEIQTFGEDTELDKQVAEKLGDPLVHLIRNSADHGIESPEARLAAGKNALGLITLKAGREGSSITIDIIDDGRGIDVAHLKAKAVEKGVLRQDQADTMPREKALELIFAAGLSTAKVVSDISGRGVGMDVVRSNIMEVGGTVSVLSEDGKGSRIRLQLPLTLAVTTAVLVSSGDCLYALPMESVRETVKVLPHSLKTLNGRQAISLRGQIIPLVSLAEVLSSGQLVSAETASDSRHTATDRSGRVPIIVVETGTTSYGIRVDELKGQQEIVIKPLPCQFGQLAGLAGATIMGDGSVMLILDPASLYDFAMNVSQVGNHDA
ncbi:MAG: Hpt domain-containing protein [Planctomycetota bacterium]